MQELHSYTTAIASRKRLSRYGIPTRPLDHSRNVSASSNGTLVATSYASSSRSSSGASSFSQVSQDATRIDSLEQECTRLRSELTTQSERAQGLEIELRISERDRAFNLNSALRLYGNAGNSAVVQTQTLFDQIEQLKREAEARDTQIWQRTQLINALRWDVYNYSNQEHWITLRQAFYALSQRYGRLPQEYTTLQRLYEKRQDELLDAFHGYRQLEGQHTELQAECDQVKEERTSLQAELDTAKRSLLAAEQRLRAPVVQSNQPPKQEVAAENVQESPESFNTRRRLEVAAVEEALMGPLGLGFKDGSPTLRSIPGLEAPTTSKKKSKFMGLFPTSTDTPGSSRVNRAATLGQDNVDEVTPARTGGARGIAREQWRVASEDLKEFTDVFKGARAKQVEIVTQTAGTTQTEIRRRSFADDSENDVDNDDLAEDGRGEWSRQRFVPSNWRE